MIYRDKACYYLYEFYIAKYTHMADEYYTQVSESIKSVFELTTRVDERVQHIMKTQGDLENKLDTNIEQHRELGTRVSVLESKNGAAIAAHVEAMSKGIHALEMRMQKIESDNKRQAGRWKTGLNFGMNILLYILVGYLLWQMGLPTPGP